MTFLPLPPPPSTPHSFRQSPHHCSCPWVTCTSCLATPFPILYFTSHGYSVTTYLYFLIPSPLHPFYPSLLPSGNHLVTNLFIYLFILLLLTFSLCLTFGILIMMCLGVGLFASIIIETLSFLDLHVYFLHQIREAFFHFFFQIDFQFLALPLLLLASL